MSHTKNTRILWLIPNKKVQFFEPYLKKSSILWVLKKFSSLSQSKKGSILWVTFLSEKINSMSRIFKKVLFFESDFWKKKLFASFFWEKKFISLSHNSLERIQIFDYFSTKNCNFWVTFKKGFDSLSQVQKKGSSLWAIFSRMFNSPSHFKQRVQFFASYSKKGSILCVIFKEKVQLYASFEEFNTLSHIEKWFLKRGSILWVIWRVQFYESYF